MKPAHAKQYTEPRIPPYLKRRKAKLHWSENTRLWRTFEFGLGIVAVLALIISIIGLFQTANEAKENRIFNAWQILSSRSTSNTAKKAALETLNNAEENLRGIDLSCETMNGMDKKNESCDAPTFLANVSLPNAGLERANLSDADLRWANLSDVDLFEANLSNAYLLGANLSDADLSFADLSAAYLFFANLSDADLIGANLSDADLIGANLSDADLIGANLSDADLSFADLSDADLREANLSNVSFCHSYVGCAENLTQAQLTQAQIDVAWAWADSTPPIFKAGEEQLDLKPPPLCPIELRPEYEASEQRGKPLAC